MNRVLNTELYLERDTYIRFRGIINHHRNQLPRVFIISDATSGEVFQTIEARGRRNRHDDLVLKSELTELPIGTFTVQMNLAGMHQGFPLTVNVYNKIAVEYSPSTAWPGSVIYFHVRNIAEEHHVTVEINTEERVEHVIHRTFRFVPVHSGYRWIYVSVNEEACSSNAHRIEIRGRDTIEPPVGLVEADPELYPSDDE